MGEIENAYVRLEQYLQPPNPGKSSGLVDISDDKIVDELVLHLYLDERNLPPKDCTDMSRMVSIRSFALTTSLSASIV